MGPRRAEVRKANLPNDTLRARAQGHAQAGQSHSTQSPYRAADCKGLHWGRKLQSCGDSSQKRLAGASSSFQAATKLNTWSRHRFVQAEKRHRAFIIEPLQRAGSGHRDSMHFTSKSLGKTPRTLAVAVASTLLFACIGPTGPGDYEGGSGSRGSMREFEQLLAEGALEIVQGEVVEPSRLSDEELAEAQEQQEGLAESRLAKSLSGSLSGESELGLSQDQQDVSAVPELIPALAPNPFLQFGSRIIVQPDGRITKPYPMPPGKGKRMLDLMKLFSNFPVKVLTDERETDGDPGVVEAVLLEKWDIELYRDLRISPPGNAAEVPMADWLVCTAGSEALEEVEHFIDLFGAGVPQIEIEAKIIEVTERDTSDWGVDMGSIDFPDNTLLNSLAFSMPNAAGANEALLSLGAVQDGSTFDAVLEAVQSWENVSIVAHPKVAVREGGRAEIISTEDRPFFAATSINATGGINTQLQFREVGVRLYIVPHVVGTSTLALNIDIEASQDAGSSVTFVTNANEPVVSPIIASRAVRTHVYLRPGQAVILGGLKNERNVEQERKVPILGDIPLLGWLFKSKFTVKETAYVVFYIKPRVLSGSDLNRDF